MRKELPEVVNATLDGNSSNETGKDLRLTVFGALADQNTMNTELYKGVAVSDYTALKAITGAADGDVCSVAYRSTAGDQGGGIFYFDASDLSTEVTADTQNGIYVPPSSDTTGGSGAWVRQYSGAVNVKWFGAVGDGVTEDGVAIRAAIDHVTSLGGGIVVLPFGIYAISSRLLWRDNLTIESPSKATIRVMGGVDSPVIGIVDQQTTPHIKNIKAKNIVFDGNATNSPGVTAHSDVILDPIDGAYFENCQFTGARGYGASLQYLATGVPDNNRVKNITFVKCDFDNNGMGLAVPGTLYDGIDVKNCNNLVFINCRAYDNYQDGFDFRGENIDMIACEAWGNGQAGLQLSANANGHTQNSSMRVFGGHYNTNTYGISIANNPAGGEGLGRISIVGANIRANTSNGIHFFYSNAGTYASVSDCMVFSNGGNGVSILGAAKQIALNSCDIVNNTGDGVYCNMGSVLQINGGLLVDNGGYGYREGENAIRNTLSGGLRIIDNVTGQLLLNPASRLTKVSDSILDYIPNGSAPSDIIASASTITLPEGGKFFVITGSVTIDEIALSQRGRTVTLQIADGTPTIVDAGTLRLAGNFVGSTDDTITLTCNGTIWFEVARSVN